MLVIGVKAAAYAPMNCTSKAGNNVPCWKQCAIAQALGVTPGAVSQWLCRAKAEGMDALKERVSPGAPSKLTKQ